MSQDTFGLPKIPIVYFTGRPVKWLQWFNFFKATIHNNSDLTNAQKIEYLENSVTHQARAFLNVFFYNDDCYHEVIAKLTKRIGKLQHIVAACLDQLEKWPKLG